MSDTETAPTAGMTEERLAEIGARADGGTDGYVAMVGHCGESRRVFLCLPDADGWMAPTDEDGMLFANARKDELDLLAEVRRLRAELARTAEQRDRMRDAIADVKEWPSEIDAMRMALVALHDGVQLRRMGGAHGPVCPKCAHWITPGSNHASECGIGKAVAAARVALAKE